MGFLESEFKQDQYQSLFATAQTWINHCGVSHADIEASRLEMAVHIEQFTEDKRQFDRMFIRDAERAFVTTTNRITMMHILTIMQDKMGDYHQGMGLICAFLLLTLSPAEVLAILSKVAFQGKYLPDYWKSESVACATDGYLWKDLVETRFPDVGNTLTANSILPETFVQKWFCALCVHVLPFSALVHFMTNFFEHGHAFLFRFGLTLVKQFRTPLLECKSQAQIYAILRLDLKDSKHVTLDAIMSLVPAHIKICF